MHFTSVAHAARFKDITFVLLKYGFDEVVQRLDVPGKVLLEKVVRTKEGLTEEQRLRGVIEELGPTFIKFGQVLGLRSGLLPPDLARELRKLQDEVAAVPFEKIRARIEKSLGQPLD
ncbi:MAG: ABC transporter, partial [Acidobacteriota bacterium]